MTIRFGETYICPRCGEIAIERYRFAARFAGHNDAWAIQYCEHCTPPDLMAALTDTLRQNTTDGRLTYGVQ